MPLRGKNVLVVPLAILFLTLPACETQKGPAKGSPEYNYEAARESFQRGEIERTQEDLEKIVAAGANPFQLRAGAWDLLLKSGRLLGYEELIDTYAAGFPKAQANKSNFTREKETLLKEVRGYALHLLESDMAFEKLVTDQPIKLEFPFPDGSAAPPADLEKIDRGVWPVEAERQLIYDKVLQRGLIRAVSAGITSLDDAPGAKKAMAGGSADVPQARFLMAIADTMSRTAKFFDDKNLAESDKRKLLLDRTVEIVKKVRAMKPDADMEKAAKKLQDGAEKDLKSVKK